MSRLIGLIGFSLILSSALPGAEGRSPAQQFSLDEYKWINRLIILAAPASTDERLVMQRGLLYSEAEGLEDRDLRILELIAEDEGRFGHQRVNRESARKTRKALDLPGDSFQILLIGKDGSVKLRSPASLEASALFSVIDSMPMRQREMRESRQSQD